MPILIRAYVGLSVSMYACMSVCPCMCVCVPSLGNCKVCFSQAWGSSVSSALVPPPPNFPFLKSEWWGWMDGLDWNGMVMVMVRGRGGEGWVGWVMEFSCT